MPVQRPFLLYLRSRFHITLALAAGGLVVLAILFFRPRVLAPVVVIAALYAVLTGALFFTRRGAREVVAEDEEDRRRGVREKIARFSAVRERIAVLRLGDERMSRAVELFLQESGSYLEKCRELDAYSPLANERIERVLEICQVFLGEMDESATGRRYGVPGSGRDEAPAERFSRDITECAAVVRQRISEDLLGIGGEERLSIMKELEEKK